LVLLLVGVLLRVPLTVMVDDDKDTDSP